VRARRCVHSRAWQSRERGRGREQGHGELTAAFGVGRRNLAAMEPRDLGAPGQPFYVAPHSALPPNAIQDRPLPKEERRKESASTRDRHLERAAIFQVGGDAGCTERVTAGGVGRLAALARRLILSLR
jgi:hypothetical protein